MAYRYTYDIITPESAEDGDYAECGFWMPGGWRHPLRDADGQTQAAANTGDFDIAFTGGWISDIKDTLGALDHVQVFGKQVQAYEADGDEDFSTGAVMRKAVHITCPTAASALRVARAIASR